MVTDKEYAKIYIRAVLGEGYVIPTLHVLRHRDEITEFSPKRTPCVLKPTNGSGQLMICRNADIDLDRGRLRKWFDLNYYEQKREPQYRHLIPKIIVEDFFAPNGESPPDDYKLWCVRGSPKMIQVDSGRLTGHTRNLYDTNWNRFPASLKYPARDADDPKPRLLAEMLTVARLLSAPFPFVRVDLYASETALRVGELTFTPGAAAELLQPNEFEHILGHHCFSTHGSSSKSTLHPISLQAARKSGDA